jgi:hypothetical protein
VRLGATLSLIGLFAALAWLIIGRRFKRGKLYVKGEEKAPDHILKSDLKVGEDAEVGRS